MTPDAEKLVIALPSKGRLQEQCVAFLSGCGFAVRRVGGGRDYVGSLVGLDDAVIIYLRPDEIPSRVEQGDAHIGITGEDLYREYADREGASWLLMPKLGFGGARLVVAVPQSWVDVSSMADLDEAAMLFHQRHGRSLRVATKFSRLTRSFFAEHGIIEYSLVGSSGATEGTPAAGVADFIVDLTSTGATLAENHLKEISGGTVLETEASMIASLHAGLWSGRTLAALEHLVEQIEARLRATSRLMLRFSMPSKTAAKRQQELTKNYGCVLSSWNGNGNSKASDERTFIVASCERSQLYAVVKFLKSSGATGILVDRGEFIFEGASPALLAFNDVLARGDAAANFRAASGARK